MIGWLIVWGLVLSVLAAYWALEESERGQAFLDKQARRVER